MNQISRTSNDAENSINVIGGVCVDHVNNMQTELQNEVSTSNSALRIVPVKDSEMSYESNSEMSNDSNIVSVLTEPKVHKIHDASPYDASSQKVPPAVIDAPDTNNSVIETSNNEGSVKVLNVVSKKIGVENPKGASAQPNTSNRDSNITIIQSRKDELISIMHKPCNESEKNTINPVTDEGQKNDHVDLVNNQTSTLAKPGTVRLENSSQSSKGTNIHMECMGQDEFSTKSQGNKNLLKL